MCLSTLYLSLLPERSVTFLAAFQKEYIKFLCYTPESSVNFKKRQSVSLWNFLVNTLLLYIPLFTLTDGQNDRQRPNTLATHGLEEHFSSCAVVSVFWLWWKQFQVILTFHTSCAVVSFFCCSGKKFLVAWVHFLVVAGNSFRYYFLTYHTSCAVVSVFWLQREIVFGYSVSKKDSYSISLIERQTASKCVYFIRSNTLLLCVSLLSICLLYRKDQ